MDLRFPIRLFGGGAGGADAGGGSGGGDSGTGGGGATAPAWLSSLTGDFAPLSKEKSLEQIKGSNWDEAGPVLAKGYVEAQKRLGGMVALPKPDATGKVDPAATRELWTKLGVPTDVTGYKDVRLNVIEGLGAVNEKLIDAAKPIFLKTGLTPQQGQEMLNLYASVTSQQRRELADSFVAMQADLEEKWGLNFESNFNLAQRALKKYFPDSFLKLLRDSQLDMHPGMIEGMHAMGQHLGEAKFIEGSEPTVADNEATEKEINTIREQLLKVNEGSPERRVLQEKMEALYKKRYGTGPVGPQR